MQELMKNKQQTEKTDTQPKEQSEELGTSIRRVKTQIDKMAENPIAAQITL